jgi:predicted ATPase
METAPPRSTRPLRYVITGGPFSGKTSLVRALAAQGFATVPEAAIEVIEDLKRELGLDGQAAWRAEHREEFQERIIQKQLVLEEREHVNGPLFLDRGRLDGVAYCHIYGSEVPPPLAFACSDLPYDNVFLLDTLTAFEGRTKSGRTSDRKRSLAIRDALRDVYTERGLEPIEVPEMPLVERVDFVVAALALGD